MGLLTDALVASQAGLQQAQGQIVGLLEHIETQRDALQQALGEIARLQDQAASQQHRTAQLEGELQQAQSIVEAQQGRIMGLEGLLSLQRDMLQQEQSQQQRTAQLEGELQQAKSFMEIQRVMIDDQQRLLAGLIPEIQRLKQDADWLHAPTGGVAAVWTHMMYKEAEAARRMQATADASYSSSITETAACRVEEVGSRMWGSAAKAPTPSRTPSPTPSPTPSSVSAPLRICCSIAYRSSGQDAEAHASLCRSISAPLLPAREHSGCSGAVRAGSCSGLGSSSSSSSSSSEPQVSMPQHPPLAVPIMAADTTGQNAIADGLLWVGESPCSHSRNDGGCLGEGNNEGGQDSTPTAQQAQGGEGPSAGAEGGRALASSTHRDGGGDSAGCAGSPSPSATTTVSSSSSSGSTTITAGPAPASTTAELQAPTKARSGRGRRLLRFVRMLLELSF